MSERTRWPNGRNVVLGISEHRFYGVFWCCWRSCVLEDVLCSSSTKDQTDNRNRPKLIGSNPRQAEGRGILGDLSGRRGLGDPGERTDLLGRNLGHTRVQRRAAPCLAGRRASDERPAESLDTKDKRSHRRHYGRQTALEDLAQADGYSRLHFLRTFTKTLGMTPSKYVMHRRVRTAVSMAGGTRE